MKAKVSGWLVALLICFNVFAQNKADVKTIKVSKSIYMFQGQGGNIGVCVGEDGVFLIDDQFAETTPKIVAAIKKISDKPIRFLLNTHWHGDHTGGNVNMGNNGVIIVAQNNARVRLSNDQMHRGELKKALPKIGLPIITFTENMHFYFNDNTINVFHVHHAHTDGDAVVYFPDENVIHTGDVYFQGKYPFIDLETGGSVQGTIDAVNKILLLADENTKIIPGHKNLSNKSELLAYRDMLITIRDTVKNKIKEGKTKEEIKNDSTITKKYDDLDYGTWFIKPAIFRETVYNSLKNSKS